MGAEKVSTVDRAVVDRAAPPFNLRNAEESLPRAKEHYVCMMTVSRLAPAEMRDLLSVSRLEDHSTERLPTSPKKHRTHTVGFVRALPRVSTAMLRNRLLRDQASQRAEEPEG